MPSSGMKISYTSNKSYDVGILLVNYKTQRTVKAWTSLKCSPMKPNAAAYWTLMMYMPIIRLDTAGEKCYEQALAHANSESQKQSVQAKLEKIS